MGILIAYICQILNNFSELVLWHSVESLSNLLIICCSFNGIKCLLSVLDILAVGFCLNKDAFLRLAVLVGVGRNFYRWGSHCDSILLILQFHFHTLGSLVSFDLSFDLLLICHPDRVLQGR